MSPNPWRGFDAAAESDAQGVNAVLEAGRSVGADPQELAWAIELETAHTWSPSIRSPVSGAVGLLQWLPSTLESMQAPEADDVAHMTREQQAELVAEYFKHTSTAFHMEQPGDVLLAVFFPAALGRADTYRIAEPYTRVWKDNPTYRSARNGAITAGSVRKIGTPPKSGGPVPGASLPDDVPVDVPPEKTKVPEVTPVKSSDGLWWLIALVLLARRNRG